MNSFIAKQIIKIAYANTNTEKEVITNKWVEEKNDIKSRKEGHATKIVLFFVR